MINLSDNQKMILYSVISAYASSGKHKTYALVMGMKLVKTWHEATGLYQLRNAVQPAILMYYSFS